MLIFVYGTLKRGDVNHHFMWNARFVGVGLTPKGWSLYNLGECPAAVPDSEGKGVLGELYEVDSLRLLDQLEGYPRLYDRKIVTIRTRGGDYDAWMYYIDSPRTCSEKIISGHWQIV